MNGRLDPAQQAWIHADETRAVMIALLSDGGDARFVGGAVRNALLGLDVDDIDIATPLLPEEVTRRLEAARIKAVPTGIDHGTVTAISGGRPFEVTTLRRDVETDGRHAVIAFSESWEEDASRRDFTLNALYASQDGEVFDYFGGLADLEARHIRFIGDPVARIREDYLRILRLFRFHAWYGRGEMDEQALVAVEAERAGLARLSGERIQKEMLRLLEAKNPSAAIRIMARSGILQEIIPDGSQPDRLEHLVAIDTTNGFRPDPIQRLSALLPADTGIASAVVERLRLSNENRDRVVDLADRRPEISAETSRQTLRKLIYRLGKVRLCDRIILRWADDTNASHNAGWRNLFDEATKWDIPKFPLSGRDVVEAGIAPGPLVGSILSQIEDEWIESDFTKDRSMLAQRLRTMVHDSGN
ncbi:MAG TPA: CCA tRNA nucleotidyltransferase [Rhizomicrobium sp.]|jgi:poly(A) polymerase